MAAKVKTLDFSGVKDGGGNFRPRRRKEGDYYARITAVADHLSKEKNPGWVFTIKVEGDARATYPYYCGFDEGQLWKSRGLCIAAGLKVPSAKVKMDPNKLVNKVIGIALVDDEYEGRVKSQIDGVFPIDELSDAMNEPSTKSKSRKAEEEDDEDEDEDEEPAPAKSKKRQPEEDEDEDDEDDEPPAKAKKGKVSAAKKKSRDDEEDDDDEEEDDEEPPAKSKKSSVKKGKAKKAKDDDDDDDELDLDEL
jgi:hypothetical protein